MSGIFGGQQQQAVTPVAAAAVPPPPERTDAQTESLANRQKARFNREGSFTNNYFGGGMGSGGVSTTARVLGGVA